MNRLTLALSAAVIFGAAGIASAAPPPPPPPPPSTPAYPTLTNVGCPGTTTLFSNAAVVSCVGFWSGNLLNKTFGNPLDADESGPLALLGYGPTQNVIQKIDAIADGSQFINFTAPLFGTTVLAMHWGNGVFNANYPNYDGNGGTAFFVIDAGNLPGGLDQLELRTTWRQSISNATLYRTGAYDPPGGGLEVVPEPATMTLLATGLVAMAAASRRRRKNG